MKKRILFLMSDTGGGHRASAQAISEAIHRRFPHHYTTIIEDIWKHHTPWPINCLPNTYPWLSGPGQPLWKMMWAGSSRLPAERLFFPAITPLLESKAVRFLQKTAPDLIVSVHPLFNRLGMTWLKQANLDVPFATVVTDMVTIHPLWIYPGVTRCLVPTYAARNLAIKWGMPPEKVKVCGQPVSLKFANLAPNKVRIRQSLGLDTTKPTVLLVSGGEGTGPVFNIARAIAHSTPAAQLLIVCGRNQSLQSRLQAVTWEIPVRIYGFVDTMPELMTAADILITKAGPGTLSEAFIAGLPTIIFDYIPGQEAGNVAYVQKHQAGVYIKNPREIAALVQQWVNPADSTLVAMARNAASLAQPTASLKIAAELCYLIDSEARSGRWITPNSQHPDLSRAAG